MFLAVIVWVAIDILAAIDTPKLIVPNVFQSGFYSNPDRGFIINPLGEFNMHTHSHYIYIYMYMYIHVYMYFDVNYMYYGLHPVCFLC